ncbi:MAG: hypothetical protein H6662_14080 [Ardenticatenaceae bacterium]|nr:hypothetical protein [Ardenticatenaceae bacterium]
MPLLRWTANTNRRTRPPLADDHLLLHGSHDMDVTSFAGMQQFDRVSFSGEVGWKTAVTIYGANHANLTKAGAARHPFSPRQPLQLG